MSQENDALGYISEFDKAGFVCLSTVVLRDRSLTDSAKLLYALILSYARQKMCAWPGLDTLAQARGLSRQSIIKYLNELLERGLITKKRRGLKKTNVYYVMPLHTVYSEKGNPDKLSEKTQQDTGIIFTNQSEDSEIEQAAGEGMTVENVKAIAQIASTNNNTVSPIEQELLEAEKTAQEEHEKRKEEHLSKQIQKETRRFRNHDAELESKGIKMSDLKEHWLQQLNDRFSDITIEPWLQAEESKVKKLLQTYSVETVKGVFGHVVHNWDDMVERFKLDGPPTIRWLYAYRQSIFADFESQGRYSPKAVKRGRNGQKTRSSGPRLLAEIDPKIFE